MWTRAVVDVFALPFLLAAVVGWLDQKQQEALTYLIEEHRILRDQLRELTPSAHR